MSFVRGRDECATALLTPFLHAQNLTRIQRRYRDVPHLYVLRRAVATKLWLTAFATATGWGVLVLIYLLASLRTNAVFVALFTFLDSAFWLLVAICELPTFFGPRLFSRKLLLTLFAALPHRPQARSR